MTRLISIIGLTLVLVSCLHAQNEQPKFVDEFGDIQTGDLLARSGTFASHLQENPTAKGLIKIFRREGYGLIRPYTLSAWLKADLVNTYGISQDRVLIQHCKTKETATLGRLYLVPTTGMIPKCDESIDAPKESTLIASEYGYPNGHPYFDQENIYSVEGGDDAIDFAIASFLIELLGKSAQSRIYLVSYSGAFTWEKRILKEEAKWNDGKLISEDKWDQNTITSFDSPKESKKLAKKLKMTLVKNGIPSSRIKIISGGYKINERMVETWFAPENDNTPEPKPNYFPNKKKK